MAGDSIFLKAQWRKLAMVNYIVDPAILRSYLPAHTQLDLFEGRCYVSLVGFMFVDTRVKGIAIPFHRDFEEVNLRIYVKHQADGELRRGVVFIKEIVPRTAITFVANTLYHEKYQTLPMDHEWKTVNNILSVAYRWKLDRWHSMSLEAEATSIPIVAGSDAEFITEHYWGYTKIDDSTTDQYEVRHPRWQIYPVKHCTVDVDFKRLYGPAFSMLSNQNPSSVFLAEGSAIEVLRGTRIR